jgi:cytochrome o ubiquinol oxidase operon protein cyoD
MGRNAKVVASDHDAARGSVRTYVTGFALSVILTLMAFILVKVHVDHHHGYPSDSFMMAALPGLALVQLFVQLVFFLHVGRESKPRWNAWALSFAITVVVIVVGGSLWIMSNLNYRMMSSPHEIRRYLNSQGDL